MPIELLRGHVHGEQRPPGEPGSVRAPRRSVLLGTVALALAALALGVGRYPPAPTEREPTIHASGAFRPATAEDTAADAPRPTLRVTSSDDRGAAAQACFDQAIAALERGDTPNAKLAYRDAVLLARDDPTGLSVLVHGSERFQRLLRSEERFDRVRDAFDGADFQSALALLYRLPAESQGPRAERLKAEGWYDLAVIALRRGDCETAVAHLGEATELYAALPGLRGLSSLAEQCSVIAKDRRYYAMMDRVGFVGVRSTASHPPN